MSLSVPLLSLLSVSRDQLEGHVRRLQEELQRERDERNFYQLERDRIDTFWEVTRRELEETRAEVRVKDRSGRQQPAS